MNTKVKIESLTKQIFAMIQLLYLKSKGLNTLTKEILDSTAEIYELKEEILHVLVDKNIIVNTGGGLALEYKWGNWGEPNMMMANTLMKAYTELVGEPEEPPHETIRNVQDKPVRRERISWSVWETEFILAHMDTDNNLLGGYLKRTPAAVGKMKDRLKSGEKEIPAEIRMTPVEIASLYQRKRAWGDEDLQFMKDNMDMRNAELAYRLKRKYNAVQNMKSKIKTGKVSVGEAPTPTPPPQAEQSAIAPLTGRWSDEEIRYVYANMDASPRDIGEALNRKTKAASNVKHRLNIGIYVVKDDLTVIRHNETEFYANRNTKTEDPVEGMPTPVPSSVTEEPVQMRPPKPSGEVRVHYPIETVLKPEEQAPLERVPDVEAPEAGRYKKKWLNDSINIVAATMGEPEEWVANIVGRTPSAVSGMRHHLRAGTKKATISEQQQLLLLNNLKRKYKRNGEERPVGRKKRISLLWGLISWETS